MSHATEEAVSSVVGTVLMLGITVAVFGGLSVVALDYVSDHRPSGARSDLSAVEGGQSLLLTHQGGESFQVGGRLLVNVDGYEVEVGLDDASLAGLGLPSLAQLGLDDSWSTGDTLCVWGDDASCLYDPDVVEVLGAAMVTDGRLLMDIGERGAQGSPSVDLVPTLVSQSPTTAAVGDSLAWTVRVTNAGPDRAGARSILVTVEVDGAQVATATVAGPILGGASATATTTAWTGVLGSHSLRLTVDPTDVLAETDEANNQATSTFEVAAGVSDPGQPFVDANGDGLYTPGTDTTVTATDVQDGSFDAGSGSLVLPQSVGDISASTVSFTAGGDILVNIEVTATDGPIALTAGGDITFDEASLDALKPNRALTLSAGGSIDAPGLDVSVNGAISITATGTVNLSGAHLVVTSSNEALTIVGSAVNLDAATLDNCSTCNTGNTIAVRSTAGAISANAVDARSKGDQFWKSVGGGIDLDGATLAANSGKLEACIPSSGFQFSLGGTLTFTDTSGTNNRLEVSHGTSTTDCTGNANSATSTNVFVADWPSSSSTSPRSKVENGS